MGGGIERDAADRLNLNDADTDPEHLGRRVVFQLSQRKGQVRPDVAAGIATHPIFAESAEPLCHGKRRSVIGAFPQRFCGQGGDIGRLVGKRFQKKRLFLCVFQAEDLFHGLNPVLCLPGPKPFSDWLALHGYDSSFVSASVFVRQAAIRRSSSSSVSLSASLPLSSSQVKVRRVPSWKLIVWPA